MQSQISRIALSLLLFCLNAGLGAQGQNAPALRPQPSEAAPSQAVPDPLALGKMALLHREFASAQEFFAQYLKEDPGNAAAMLGEGNAELGLKNYAAAKDLFEQTIAADPHAWAAHENLVIAYAKLGDWKDFDAERATLEAAKAAHQPGLPAQSSTIIDVLEVNGKDYIARQYDPPMGRFHVKYNFAHLDEKGRPDDGWISCESDDIDQVAFAKAHPDEAAAGKRSYSLDSYSAIKTMPDGKRSQTHGTLKLYLEGEPSYETVRADVMRVLGDHAAPLSTTTVVGK